MGWVTVQGVQWPPAPPWAATPVLATTLLTDATGEKTAILGFPQTKDVGKSLVSVGFRFGAVTKAGGSALIVSHQDLNSAAGAFPGQPDEVIDGSVAVANADAAFLSNTWINTGNFDVARTMSASPFAIVVEYDGAGRLGADSVIVSGYTPAAGSAYIGPALKTAGWAAQGVVQNILFTFGDGTFGTFLDSFPNTGFTTTAYNNGSAADEYALEFTVPAPMKVDGAWVNMAVALVSSDFDVVLYNGTTVIISASVDANWLVSTTARPARIPFPEQTLTPGNTYHLAVKPTTANNLTVYDFTVNNANHFQAWPLGTSAYLATRVDAGAWTPLTTRRPMMGLYVSAISDGVNHIASRQLLGM